MVKTPPLTPPRKRGGGQEVLSLSQRGEVWRGVKFEGVCSIYKYNKIILNRK